MSNIENKAIKRYQNPELFEQLAIEYAVGSLHGRARKRFEVLMDTHFYLQAVVDAYENKFANLVELLPDEKPSDKVWNNIEAHIKESKKETKQAATSQLSSQPEKSQWWQTSFFKQGFGMAFMALVIAGALFLNPMTGTPVATAYSAVLESGANEAMAVTKINQAEMKLSIDIMKPMKIDDSMELTLWCHPKGGGMPMKMGTISKTGKTDIKISKKEWQNMKDVGMLAVSVEHKGENLLKKPSGKIILTGQLNIADMN
ncbi:MAG: anti-sigma factor [Cocleimonas sp.]